MKMLVTGGAGFIGQGLVRELIKHGHNVVVLDNLDKDAAFDIPGAVLIRGDVRDRDLVFRLANGCDVIWHLAYINGTRNFYKRQDEILEVGVKGTLNTIDAALAHGVKRYVIASSSEVYNNPTVIPTPETERLMVPDVKNPRFSYSGGKIISELLAYIMLKSVD